VCNDRTGNFCAVGTFDPGVEIWNLDVLNALEPICVLGGQDTSMTDDIMRMQVLGEKAKMSKFQTPEGLRPGSHTDAVMCLSWNNVHKHVIASGSADTTVKLWDVTKGNTNGANASTFTHHSDKVQALAWNPAEGTLLATGSFDRTVALVDARSDGRNVKSFKTVADCESIAWDPFATERLTVVTEDGTMACWDVRNLKTPLWSKEISAFGGTTDISFNQHVKGLAVTCSIDKTVTLWDLHGSEPYTCGSKDMCSGKLYTVGFYPSSPWLLGCGGGGNQLALWDLSSEAALQKRFADRLKSGSTTTSADAPAVAASGESLASTPMADSFLNADGAPQADSSNTTSTRQKKKKGSSKKKPHKRRG
jgi:periodic tryptophan protein 1